MAFEFLILILLVIFVCSLIIYILNKIFKKFNLFRWVIIIIIILPTFYFLMWFYLSQIPIIRMLKFHNDLLSTGKKISETKFEHKNYFALTAFSIIENNIKIANKKGEFSHWSVPEGFLKKLKHIYIKSLKDTYDIIPENIKSDLTLLEDNSIVNITTSNIMRTNINYTNKNILIKTTNIVSINYIRNKYSVYFSSNINISSTNYSDKESKMINKIIDDIMYFGDLYKDLSFDDEATYAYNSAKNLINKILQNYKVQTIEKLAFMEKKIEILILTGKTEILGKTKILKKKFTEYLDEIIKNDIKLNDNYKKKLKKFINLFVTYYKEDRLFLNDILVIFMEKSPQIMPVRDIKKIKRIQYNIVKNLLNNLSKDKRKIFFPNR